jgi:hypothetical protein
MPTLRFDTFSVEVPIGWVDITAEVESDNPPCTLARPDGVGALQFSIARFIEGEIPNPTVEDLHDMVLQFGQSQMWGEGIDWALESLSSIRFAAATFTAQDDFVRIWQMSDGSNFALVTYTCAPTDSAHELPDCERIVRSFQFRPRVTSR